MIPNYEYEFETMVISFQKLSVDPDDSVSEDGYSQRSLFFTRWETILCKLSSAVSIREKSIKNREEAVCAQECDIQLLKERSASLECKICFYNNCSIISYPCNHFAMCSPCFNTLLRLGHICCPVCRGAIQGHSNVYIT